MISLIRGTDKTKILFFFDNQKKLYNKSEVFELNISDEASLKDLVYSNNLFTGNKKLIILNPTSLKDITWSDTFMDYLINNKEVAILIDINKIKTKDKLFEKYKDKIRLLDFAKTPSFLSFKIADEIIIYGNKSKALSLLEEIEDIDIEFYSILGAISYTIRCYFSVKYQNKFSKTLKPFVVNKMKLIKQDEEKMKNLYKELVDLDFKSKTTQESLKSLLQELIIVS